MRFKAYTVAFHLRISAIPLLVHGKKRAARARKRCDKLPELVKKYQVQTPAELTYANKHKYFMFRRGMLLKAR